MKPLTHVDIVLSVFNQENLIEKVLHGIFKNTTTPFTLIMVFDGCTDRTEVRAKKYIKRYSPKLLKEFISTSAPNVYETRANNIGFKLSKSDFMITLQDDMVINEYGWERRITFPLRKFEEVLAVTSRSAHDIDHIDETNQYYKNHASRERGTLSRNVFAVRDIINRGPVAFTMKHLRSMNFLNEDFAPSDLDDADLSLRAWEKKKLIVGAYWIDYLSPLHWGKSRAADSTMNVVNKRIMENGIRLLNNHRAYIESGIKHSKDIPLLESEVDYLPFSIVHRLKGLVTQPYRINRKGIMHAVKIVQDFIKEITMMTLELVGKKNVREIGIKKSLGL